MTRPWAVRFRRFCPSSPAMARLDPQLSESAASQHDIKPKLAKISGSSHSICARAVNFVQGRDCGPVWFPTQGGPQGGPPSPRAARRGLRTRRSSSSMVGPGKLPPEKNGQKRDALRLTGGRTQSVVQGPKDSGGAKSKGGLPQQTVQKLQKSSAQ